MIFFLHFSFRIRWWLGISCTSGLMHSRLFCINKQSFLATARLNCSKAQGLPRSRNTNRIKLCKKYQLSNIQCAKACSIPLKNNCWLIPKEVNGSPPQGLQGQLLVGNPIFFCCRRHMSFKIVQDSWLKKKAHSLQQLFCGLSLAFTLLILECTSHCGFPLQNFP